MKGFYGVVGWFWIGFSVVFPENPTYGLQHALMGMFFIWMSKRP